MFKLTGYTVTETIYDGENIIVYRGYRTDDHHPVIIKSLTDYPEPKQVAQFHHEYEITKALNLKGTIKHYELQKNRNSWVLILEDIQGDSLKHILTTQKFDLATFLHIAMQLADYLGELHTHNIIHKDIKPGNIIINLDREQVKITDFSISSRLSLEKQTLTSPKLLEGTLAYMSPEQTGRMNRALDYRTDLYSLGVVFYEMLVEHPPFESVDAMELVHCHIAKRPTPPHDIKPEIPSAISDIVMKLLAKTAEARYQSAYGLKADLSVCQQQLQTTGHIEKFTCGQEDISDKFQIPQKLYGRESEVSTYSTIFERISQGATEMMLVAGYSGIGKSALVQEIYKPLTVKQGYFIAGKFDQFQRNVPYLAVVKAFSDLIQQLLTESEEQLKQWRDKLLVALGVNAQVIIDVIPEVELIIGQQPPVPALGAVESQNRFNLVFQNFIRVFCQKKHPLIIFLDDLQWVDSATLKLMELMMTDTHTHHLFLIGAYRDNEVSPSHPLIVALEEFQKKQALINQITLTPLSQAHIILMLVDTLHSNQQVVKPLADRIVQKTGGNPFFVQQFLRTLHEENLFTLNHKCQCWEWDLAQIEAQGITDNVVDLMIGRLKKLPIKTQQILKLAACVGNSFNLRTLAVIHEKPIITTHHDLLPAIQIGLILPLSEQHVIDAESESQCRLFDKCKFLHDRVQQAADALIVEENKPALHLKIGRLILESMSPLELEESLFEVVDHLNQGQAFITDDSEKAQLAKLNLTAAHKAKLSSAYSAALKYVTAGMAYLPNNCWETNYTQTLSYYLEKGEIEYLNASWDDSIATFDAAFKQVNNLLDRCKINEYKATLYRMKNDLKMALDIGVQALGELGIELKAFPNEADVAADIERLKQMTAGKDIDSLFELPELEAPLKLAAMALLRECFAPAYFLGSRLISIIGIRMTEITIQYGNSPHSAVGYIFYSAITLAVNLNDYDNAYQFGKLSLRLNEERYHEKLHDALILDMWGTFVCHHKEPLPNAREYLLRGYYSGVETGSYQWGGYCAMIHVFMCFWGLHTLPGVLDKVDKIVPGLQEIDPHMIQLQYYYAVKATALNLIEPVEDWSILSEAAWPEVNEFLKVSREQDDIMTLLVDTTCRLSLANWYHDPKKAAEYAELGDKYVAGVPGVFINPVFHFHQALAYTAAYEYTDAAKQAQYLEKLQSNLSKFELWANHYPGTYLHQALLIKAEIARIGENDSEAMDLYDRAIASAGENGFTQNEALANEFAARFWLTKGKETFAQLYLKQAYYGYQQWGAKNKLSDLKEKYPQLLEQTSIVPRAIESDITLSRTLMHGTLSSATSNLVTSTMAINAESRLDLATVMKASYAISGEIVLEQLIKKFMQIVIENVGAEEGWLILKGEKGTGEGEAEDWFIEARGTVVEVQILGSMPLESVNSDEQNLNLPHTIITYAARTKTPLVLNDATLSDLFADDLYILQKRPQSVLCFPILYKNQLIGLFYLENNLITGAFTPDRLVVLKMLATQIAISLENAQWVATLDAKVADRTAQLNTKVEELTQTRHELVQSEKMASLGRLVAGFAHELNTPIGVAVGSASTLQKKSKFINNLLEQEEVDEEELVSALDTIDQAADLTLSNLRRAAGLVKSFKRTAVDQTSEDVRKFEVKTTIEDVINTLHNKFKQTAIEIQLDCPDDLAVYSIPGVLEQILTNLLMNSLIHGFDEGKNAGSINTKVQFDGNNLCLEYSDNGKGISEENLEKIFEPFFTTHRAHGGSGLGMYICYNLVTSQLHGTMSCDSTLGKGVVFRIEFPIQPEEKN
ncbi:ATP-binding sensor histidine kinase [Candidatus Parabeggiatoa sp. HSG14]|uniref:trifunctional serine/threonine-protein kinase/ATP-binding protein/sensor histidine kinase n=1 Tax=Candidatus Parabeggiatoa sp. HSG14 TaxID=3055593 RepID=UPI0025A91F7D|nr:ATP-binding sensor histidine kinase [Thiotrichales bacterium HSG14]